MVRPALKSGYRPVINALRVASDELDGIGDELELATTFDRLLTRMGPLVPDGGLEGVRYRLRRRAARATTATADPRFQEPAHRSLVALVEAEGAVSEWKLVKASWDTVAVGIASVYADGRHALAVAQAVPSSDHFRRWRRKARYTRYHLRLLSDTAPSQCVPLAERLHDVSNALGDAHRLERLVKLLLADPDVFCGRAEVDQAITLADGCRVDLQRRALGVGARLFAEEPTAFADRLGGYRRVWHDLGDEPEVGGISAARLGL